MSDSEEDGGSNPELDSAARKGDLSEVQKLVKDWPSTNSLEEGLQSALNCAVQSGRVPVASYLLDHGAKFSSDISHLAIERDVPNDMFQTALDHGWDINGLTKFGSPILT